ncbi:MAG: nucleotidyltransferase domain-containing protein [Archaeoglobaceae archaeon]|nr:nucleotidyltransferase domain-containing protein [Archaeoglobaceae archaeon]
MGRKDVDLNKVERFLKKISRKYGIKKAVIFGSSVKGEFREDGDIDLIVISDEFEGVSPLKRPVKLYLEWDLDYPVDFICYTTKEFEELRKRPSLVKEALKEGRVVELG